MTRYAKDWLLFFQFRFPFLLGTQLLRVPAFITLAESIHWAVGNGVWARGHCFHFCPTEASCATPVFSLFFYQVDWKTQQRTSRHQRMVGQEVGRSLSPWMTVWRRAPFLSTSVISWTGVRNKFDFVKPLRVLSYCISNSVLVGFTLWHRISPTCWSMW